MAGGEGAPGVGQPGAGAAKPPRPPTWSPGPSATDSAVAGATASAAEANPSVEDSKAQPLGARRIPGADASTLDATGALPAGVSAFSAAAAAPLRRPASVPAGTAQQGPPAGGLAAPGTEADMAGLFHRRLASYSSEPADALQLMYQLAMAEEARLEQVRARESARSLNSDGQPAGADEQQQQQGVAEAEQQQGRGAAHQVRQQGTAQRSGDGHPDSPSDPCLTPGALDELQGMPSVPPLSGMSSPLLPGSPIGSPGSQSPRGVGPTLRTFSPLRVPRAFPGSAPSSPEGKTQQARQLQQSPSRAPQQLPKSPSRLAQQAQQGAKQHHHHHVRRRLGEWGGQGGAGAQGDLPRQQQCAAGRAGLGSRLLLRLPPSHCRVCSASSSQLRPPPPPEQAILPPAARALYAGVQLLADPLAEERGVHTHKMAGDLFIAGSNKSKAAFRLPPLPPDMAAAVLQLDAPPRKPRQASLRAWWCYTCVRACDVAHGGSCCAAWLRERNALHHSAAWWL